MIIFLQCFIKQGSQTWSPTVKLRRSIVFFPCISVTGISTVTLALPLFPVPLPKNAQIFTNTRSQFCCHSSGCRVHCSSTKVNIILIFLVSISQTTNFFIKGLKHLMSLYHFKRQRKKKSCHFDIQWSQEFNFS